MPIERIKQLARIPVLLVAADFDGTIAPLVLDPEAARIDPRCLAALNHLSRQPQTFVAIVSGRGLDWLRVAVRGIPRAMLFGSHGAESDESSSPAALDQPNLRDRIIAALKEIVLKHPSAHVERKPFGGAIHYRRVGLEVEPEIRSLAADAAVRLGVVLRTGSMVVELTTSNQTKRDAIIRARKRAGASHAIFLGDDTTDEDGFAALTRTDLSIRIGAGATTAVARIASPEAAAEVLEELAYERSAWLESRTIEPIQTHSMLSDQRTAAIVTSAARINWLCLPRIDSPAIFSELIGGPGYFSIASADGSPPVEQNYVPDTMVLRTIWPRFTVTDYLDSAGGRAFQRAGRSDLIRVIEGDGVATITFAPRPDFGRAPLRLRIVPDGIECEGSSDPIVLRSPGVMWTIIDDPPHQTAQANVVLAALGQHNPVMLELRYGTANMRAGIIPESERRIQNERFWSGWVSALRLPSTARDVIARSALVLKALCHGPTGAIAAAATTSLPEQLGGSRNWDYRYSWPRDAAMAASSLLRLGNTGHAMKMADWLVSIVDRLESPERLRPIYTVSGDDLGPEAELTDLTGYADSRPVRISNAASLQVQLDVFGPIAEMIALMAARGVPISPDAWRLVRSIVRAVEARWKEPDHGIWEIRGPRRHYVHSKVMCWLAVDRALFVHDAVVGRDNVEWRALRDAIAADVIDHGWNEAAKAFTLAYEAVDLDAGALWIGLSGLLPPDDDRFRRTVDAVNQRLRVQLETPFSVTPGGSVKRYRFDDGLPGPEGGMIICSTWLIECFVLLGRLDEARSLFDAVCAMAGPTDLLAEQWDDIEPGRGVALGNFPQAYSHLGLINAAIRLFGNS